MDLKNLVKKVAIGVTIVILLIFAVMGSIVFDLMSYTATASQTLEPNGTAVGKAIVIYDPGISGRAKTVASAIASKLQSEGYTVDLAGIKSSKATDTSDYNVIVVGGPVYTGKAANSVQNYLKTLNPTAGIKVGIFVTGDDPDTANYSTLLLKEVTLTGNSTFQINALMKIVSPENFNQKVSDFVNALLGSG